MKICLAALMVLGLAAPALAAPIIAGPTRPALDAPQYTCARAGLSHVSLTAMPAPCCVGHLSCPQLLSNTGLVKPRTDGRT